MPKESSGQLRDWHSGDQNAQIDSGDLHTHKIQLEWMIRMQDSYLYHRHIERQWRSALMKRSFWSVLCSHDSFKLCNSSLETGRSHCQTMRTRNTLQRQQWNHGSIHVKRRAMPGRGDQCDAGQLWKECVMTSTGDFSNFSLYACLKICILQIT